MFDLGNAVLIVGVVSIFALISYASYRHEKKLWNNGRCADCNYFWEFFDLDSQGGRGYKCGCGKHSIWINWYRADH